jgi:hypothetical protein
VLLRDRQKPQRKVLNPKMILNSQFGALEKNLKANRKTSRFLKMHIHNPLPFAKKQPSSQVVIFLGLISLFSVMHNWKQTAFSWLSENRIFGVLSVANYRISNLAKISFAKLSPICLLEMYINSKENIQIPYYYAK